jgi:hypothetical protein
LIGTIFSFSLCSKSKPAKTPRSSDWSSVIYMPLRGSVPNTTLP